MSSDTPISCTELGCARPAPPRSNHTCRWCHDHFCDLHLLLQNGGQYCPRCTTTRAQPREELRGGAG